jgi:diacylglycerol kinase family enzyme
MELWLFDGSRLEDILQQAWSLWSGRHVNSNRVQCLPFQKIRMESDSPIFIQMDGEPEVGGEQVTIEVLPRVLRVMIPDQASQSLLQGAIN